MDKNKIFWYKKQTLISKTGLEGFYLVFLKLNSISQVGDLVQVTSSEDHLKMLHFNQDEIVQHMPSVSSLSFFKQFLTNFNQDEIV